MNQIGHVARTTRQKLRRSSVKNRPANNTARPTVSVRKPALRCAVLLSPKTAKAQQKYMATRPALVPQAPSVGIRVLQFLLELAIAYEAARVIPALMQLGASIAVENADDGLTPLERAVEINHSAVIKTLIENSSGDDVTRVFNNASKRCNISGAGALIKELIDNWPFYRLDQLRIIAIKNKQADIINPLVSKEILEKAAHEELLITLSCAMENGLYDFAESIFKKLSLSKQQWLAINLIREIEINAYRSNISGHIDFIFAQEIYSSLGGIEKRILMEYAARSNDVSLLEKVISKEESIVSSIGPKNSPSDIFFGRNAKERQLSQLLHIAISCGSESVANRLVEKCQKFDTPGKNGKTVLHLALQNGYADMGIRMLKKNNYAVLQNKEACRSLLCIAVHKRQENVIEEILLNRPSIFDKDSILNCADADEEAPLQVAIANRNLNTALILIRAGARLQAGEILAFETDLKKNSELVVELFNLTKGTDHSNASESREKFIPEEISFFKRKFREDMDFSLELYKLIRAQSTSEVLDSGNKIYPDELFAFRVEALDSKDDELVLGLMKSAEKHGLWHRPGATEGFFRFLGPNAIQLYQLFKIAVSSSNTALGLELANHAKQNYKNYSSSEIDQIEEEIFSIKENEFSGFLKLFHSQINKGNAKDLVASITAFFKSGEPSE